MISGKPPHRVPQRGAADPEGLAEILPGEVPPGRVFQKNDLVPECSENLVAQRFLVEKDHRLPFLEPSCSFLYFYKILLIMIRR